MEWLADPNIWIGLVTLTALEIVLGIDNIIFIAILVSRLPEHRRNSARRLGLFLAMFSRLALLASLAWIARLTAPIFSLADYTLSWRDAVLIGGGLFLLFKSTREIHTRVEGREEGHETTGSNQYGTIIFQIVLIDIVFSLDSVITAIGMVDNVWVMGAAIVIAVAVMLVASGPISAFVSAYPTVKMLALAFLLLVGTALVADGLGFHIPRGYIYFAMAFSVTVEALNLTAQRRQNRVANSDAGRLSDRERPGED